MSELTQAILGASLPELQELVREVKLTLARSKQRYDPLKSPRSYHPDDIEPRETEVAALKTAARRL